MPFQGRRHNRLGLRMFSLPLEHAPLPQGHFCAVFIIHERFKYLFRLGVPLLFQMRATQKNLHAPFAHRIALPSVLGHERFKTCDRLFKIIRLKLHNPRTIQCFAGKPALEPGRRLILRQRLLSLSQFTQRFG